MSNPPTDTHRDNMQYHTLKRCRERFGYALSREGYSKLCDDIAETYRAYIEDPRSADEFGRVRVPVQLPNQKLVIAVWCTRAKCVATLMPHEYLSPRERKKRAKRDLSGRARRERNLDIGSEDQRYFQ